MVTDVHDGHIHGPVLTDAEQLLLLAPRLDADADRLLLLVWRMDADDFVRVFRKDLSPQRLMNIIAALPSDRYRHLLNRARSVASRPPAAPASG